MCVQRPRTHLYTTSPQPRCARPLGVPVSRPRRASPRYGDKEQGVVGRHLSAWHHRHRKLTTVWRLNPSPDNRTKGAPDKLQTHQGRNAIAMTEQIWPFPRRRPCPQAPLHPPAPAPTRTRTVPTRIARFVLYRRLRSLVAHFFPKTFRPASRPAKRTRSTRDWCETW